jgi:hypothetical protein
MQDYSSYWLFGPTLQSGEARGLRAEAMALSVGRTDTMQCKPGWQLRSWGRQV